MVGADCLIFRSAAEVNPRLTKMPDRYRIAREMMQVSYFVANSADSEKRAMWWC
jgi:hypothetical protein